MVKTKWFSLECTYTILILVMASFSLHVHMDRWDHTLKCGLKHVRIVDMYTNIN